MLNSLARSRVSRIDIAQLLQYEVAHCVTRKHVPSCEVAHSPAFLVTQCVLPRCYAFLLWLRVSIDYARTVVLQASRRSHCRVTRQVSTLGRLICPTAVRLRILHSHKNASVSMHKSAHCVIAEITLRCWRGWISL